MRTEIRNGTIIAWTGDRHEVVENGVVVFEGNKIISVGQTYDGQTDQAIDATGQLVIPGLVNSHLHVTDTLYTKGYLEDVGSQFKRSKEEHNNLLYKVLPAVRNVSDPDAQVVAAECAFSELLRTGSTTVVELAYDYEIMGGGDIEPVERVAEVAGRVGLRCYSGPRYRTQFYGQADDGTVPYTDNPNKGRDRFDACIKFCRDWDGRYDGRLRTMLAPGQVDTCEADLLKETRRVADELHVPIQLHAGQSYNEFQRIQKNHGMTTVEYMADTGLLGPDFIIGHGQWMTEDGSINSMAAHEIEALRESRTTVCHLPWVKARHGGVIDSIHKYAVAGIRQCLGTDTYPFDMFNDMRMASVICKIVERSAKVASADDIFRMATVGGADALNRPDLGRLQPGCKADIVLVRFDTPKATPVYDPFKFLVLAANGEDVDRVIVDGQTLVEGGEVLTVDVPEIVRKVNAAAVRVRQRLDL